MTEASFSGEAVACFLVLPAFFEQHICKGLEMKLVLAALVAGGSVLYAKLSGPEASGSFRTGTVTRGDMLITVGATGILQPEEVVDIGAQVFR